MIEKEEKFERRAFWKTIISRDRKLTEIGIQFNEGHLPSHQ